MKTAFPNAKGSHRALAFVSGVVLFFAFCGLGETRAGLSVRFIPPFTQSSVGEVYFWLGHALLLVPGGLLIGYALAPRVATVLAHFDQELAKLTHRDITMGLGSLYVFALGIARALHILVVRDRPFTDEESAAQFGGRILASGSFAVPAPPLFEFMPNRYLFVGHGGEVSSMDWLGVQAAWAVGELLRQPPLMFAILAALPVPAIAYVIGKRVGRPWAVFGAFFFVLSPMAVALSSMAHAHLLSRGFIALTIALGVAAESSGKGTRYAWMGLAAGASLLCRPFETLCLLLPFVVAHLWRAARGSKRARASVPFVLLGLALPVLLFLFWNHRITGTFFLPPRFAAGVIAGDPSPGIPEGVSLLWHRFGANTSYNLFMLSIWFMGPVGVAFVAVGVLANRMTRLLGMGIALNLLMGLAHDNYGIHSVGPIHYSECAVPLTIIAVYGFRQTCAWLARLRVDPMQWSATVLVGIMISLGTFNYWNTEALNRQAQIHDELQRILERPDLPRAVLFVPNYSKLWHTFPLYVMRGGFVFEWPRNRPDASDHLVLMRYAPERVEMARRAYPDRKILRMHRVNSTSAGDPGVTILPAQIPREQSVPVE